MSLSGAQDVKPDVMVRRFVTRAIEADRLVSDTMASSLVREAATVLAGRYTAEADRFELRAVDHFIWRLESGRSDAN